MNQSIDQQVDKDKEFEWAFYLNKTFLTALGVWPSSEKESRLKSLRLLWILMAIVCGMCLPATYALFQVRNDVNLVVDNLLITISTWVAAAKIFFFWYYRPKTQVNFVKVYFLLIKRAEYNWFRYTKCSERLLMVKQARRGRLLTTFSVVGALIHINGFFWSPAFDLEIRIINNITDPNPQRYLPIQSYYPFEYYRSPYYELTYFSQIIALSLSALAYTSLDTFFNTLVFHASGQSEVLSKSMSKLCDQQGHQSFWHKAHELIESHIQLVRFVMDIEKSFTIAIFIQMSGCIVLLCSTVYACIQAFENNPPMKQISILILAALNVNEHIFIYCLASEILASNSLGMFDGIYNSKWYNLSSKEARYVILILARTQSPLQLSAGKFFYLSMNFYVQILKSTAGYISMLRTVS